ncbi:nudix family protein [Cystoisospora suis]|uniref:Nudix family protein n=1 Tax=Cystoisospora suis TaxID=483139 RepID=A0A2C6KC52_9APIC|nr:nudix family protein [Cystoisospora suis]
MMGNNQVASVDDSGVTYHSKGGRQRAGQQGVGCKKGGRVWGKDRCNNTTFGGGHGSGWSVEEMFRYNEEIFGVVSTYDIETYTVPLPKRPGNGRGTRDTGSSLKPGSDTHKKERKGDASQGADTVPSPAHNVTTETRLNTRRSSCVLPRGADGEIGTSDPMRGNGSNPSGHSLLLAREGEPIVASGSTDAGSPSAIRSGPTKAEAATAGEGCTDKKLPNCKPVGGFVAETSSNASVTLMGLLKRGISSNGKQSPDGASPPSKTGAVTVAAPQPVDQSSTCGLSFSEAPVPKFESCGAGKCASFDFGAFLQKVKQQQDRRIGSQSADKSQTLVRVEGTGKLVREAGAHGNSEDSAIRESVSRAMRQLARFPAVGAGEAVPSQRSCTSAQQKSEQRDLTPSTSPRGALSSSSPPTPSAISPPEYLDAKQRQRQCAGGFPGADGRERGGGFGDRGVTSPPPAPYMHATESPGYVSECPTLGQAAGGSEASYPSFEQLEDLGGDDGYAEGSRGRSTSRTSAKSVQSVSLSEGRAGGTDSGKTGIPESTKKTKGGLRVVREQEVVGCATMRENDLKWQGEWTGDRRTTAAPCEPCRNAGASDRASEKGKERLDRSSLTRRITGQQMTKFDSGSSGPGTSQKEMKGRRRRESVSSCTAEALDSLQRRDVKAGGAIENILSGGEGFDDEALSDQTILGRLRRLSHDASTLAEQGSEGRDSAVHFGRPRCAAKADSHSKAPESGRKKESCSVARDPQQSTGARSLQGRKEQPLASAVNENKETIKMNEVRERSVLQAGIAPVGCGNDGDFLDVVVEGLHALKRPLDFSTWYSVWFRVSAFRMYGLVGRIGLIPPVQQSMSLMVSWVNNSGIDSLPMLVVGDAVRDRAGVKRQFSVHCSQVARAAKKGASVGLQNR